MEIHHRDGATRRRVVDRAKVEIGELFGREQREAAATGGADGKVVGKIVVRGNTGGCADPQADDGFALAEGEGVLRRNRGEVGGNIDGAKIDRGGIRAAFVGVEPAEDVCQLAARLAEIHGHVVTIEQAAVLAGLT